jgi:hypothetical protein
LNFASNLYAAGNTELIGPFTSLLASLRLAYDDHVAYEASYAVA